MSSSAKSGNDVDGIALMSVVVPQQRRKGNMQWTDDGSADIRAKAHKDDTTHSAGPDR